MQDTVHIVLSPWDLSDSYNRHTGTTIVSILENTSRKVCVHLLYEEKFSIQNPIETEQNIQKYIEIGKKYGCDILFHPVNLPEWVNDKSRKNIVHFTPGTLLRLYVTDVISELNKIIYLDCDIIVKTDISKLWNIDIQNYSLGACLEAARNTNTRFYSKIYMPFGINWKIYFNAGFLIMNLSRLRNIDNLPEKVMDILLKNPELPYLDQDVLNYLFQNDALFIEQRYNLPVGMRMTNFGLMKKYGFNGVYDDCILHFNGRVKPWSAYSGNVDEEYWKYFAETPWGCDKEKYEFQYNSVRAVKAGIIDKIMSTRINGVLRAMWSIFESVIRLLLLSV